VKRNLLFILPGLLLLSACKITEPTINKLGDRDIDLKEPVISKIDKAQVVERYRQFVEIAKGSPLYGEAMRRLADLQLEHGEERNLSDRPREVDAGRTQMGQAIKLYTAYLVTYPKQSDNDLILYQLAKAYNLNGNTKNALLTLNRLADDFPESRYIEETQFRRGEMLFALHNYVDAGNAYNVVVDGFPNSLYFEKSLYKYGWALYKQNKYKASQLAYLRYLDRKYKQGKFGQAELAKDLPRVEKELLQDTFRVFSLAFTYQDGAKSVKKFFSENGHRAYEPLVYGSLGSLYLKKERLTDGADTYMAFVDQNPQSLYAPRFHTEAIKAYQKGGFSQLVLSAKAEFVQRYGVDSQYWKGHSKQDRLEIQPYLTLHIRELANHYHSLARKTKKPGDFQKAASWYAAYLRSFPLDKDAPGINFLLAETLFDGQRYKMAIVEFEKTAYQYPQHEKSAEAGYATLLAYNKLDKKLPQQQKATWRQKAITSSLKFCAQFPTDKRVPAVLVKTSEELYALKSYQRASDIAEQYLRRKNKKSRKLHLTALTVYGHSQFGLKHYVASEKAYKQILNATAKKDKQYTVIAERLAASIYKQGEQARDKGDSKMASYQFLRVASTVPGAAVAATASYDAAALLIKAGQYRPAANVLENFRKKYPKGHKLQAGVTEKLAVVYSKTGQGAKAAGEMLALAAASGDVKYQRETLWQAADLYEKSKEPQKALKIFKQYVKKYPSPLEPAMEARHHIAEYYRKSNNPRDWGHWLSDMVKADAKGGKQRTFRTSYLAADAVLHLATPYQNAYKQAKLTVPLKKSLKKKKKLMQQTIKAYERAMQYQVAEVTTSATYQIAEVYHEFARSLMTSERPRKLSGEDLEQYEMLLEEQSYPFEEKAIDIHTANLEHMKDGIFDKWVKSSLEIMQELQPGRYAKNEKIQTYVEAIN